MKHAAREKRKAKVVKIWKAHYPDITVREVEKLTGFSYRTIYRYLKESDQPLPPRRFRQVDMGQVKRAHVLFEKHQKKAKVARIMEMSRRQISTYLKMEIPS